MHELRPAARHLGATVVVIFACASCARPASIALAEPLPVRVTSLAPLPLPAVVVKDDAGNTIDHKVDVQLSPPGLAELKDDRIVPRARGDLTVTFRAGDKTVSSPLQIRPVTKVVLRCTPSCRLRVGDKVSVQATAYSEAELLLDVEPALSAPSNEAITVDGSSVIAKHAGQVKVHGQVGDAGDDVVIEVRDRPDRVEIDCPTVYTVSKSDDGTETKLCYLTEKKAAVFRAAAYAGSTRDMDERLEFAALNKEIAEVSPGGEVFPKASGQTALKAQSAREALLFGQIGLYVDKPRALERLFSGWAYLRTWVYGGRIYEFYAPACKSWKSFTAKAFVPPAPDEKAPTEILCMSDQAVSCVAEASLSLTKTGINTPENLRSWLGPCCCLTSKDRDVLVDAEAKRKAAVR